MEKWRIIDCSAMEGTVTSARGAILVEKLGHSPVSISVADVAVVLVGVSVKFSVAAVHRLLADDIAVIFCNWKGVPEGAAYAWSDHGRVGARHQAQAALSVPRRKNAWGRVISSKVTGQAAVLEKLGRSEAREIRSLAREVRSGDPGNIEARAARIYWRSLWSDPQFYRDPGQKRETQDSRNGFLDYAYTVLRGHGIRAVIGAGLSPALGIFHRGRGNNFALVDDLIEPFRPAIDSAVIEIAHDATLESPETRKRLVAAASRTFSRDGTTIPSAFSALAQQYGQYVEGNVSRLTVPYWAE